MKKTTDEELNAWRYQYPSSTVSRIMIGDLPYARRFVAQGNVLLFQVKNLMKPNKLGRLKGTRYFNDGTVITASSVFGRDQIIIDVSKSVGGKEPSCSVTLINIPKVIPPMKWYKPGLETFTKIGSVWEIRNPYGDVEVEGVDYIKTYYVASFTDCPGCSALDFTIGRNMGAIEASTPYRPFWYKSENDDGSLIYNYQGGMVPYYMGNDDVVPPILPDPMNHMIYSLWGSGQAEIIKADRDEGGTYILWRAYTEWSNVGPSVVDFSRTGLGYMLMQGFIKNEGLNLCESDPIIIKVDCCEKPAEERTVKLWWELGSGPFMFYGSMKLYEVPDIIQLWTIYWNACTYGHAFTLYTLPDIQGSCLPIEWTLTGRGALEPYPHPTDQYVSYPCPDPSPYLVMDCNDIVITAKDRCGTEKTITAKCCDFDWPGKSAVTMSYTSLSMNVNTEQFVGAGGGCPPYSWSYTGDGSLDVDPSRPQRDWATYTAPPTNTNCLNNDSITVTDCCGESAGITIYATNVTPGTAFVYCDNIFCGFYGCPSPYNACRFRLVSGRWQYDCAGALLYSTFYAGNVPVDSFSSDYCDTGYQLMCRVDWGECNCDSTCTYLWGCPQLCDYLDYPPDGLPCKVYNDVRTTTMKEAGCCPLNPLTGLPFS